MPEGLDGWMPRASSRYHPPNVESIWTLEGGRRKSRSQPTPSISDATRWATHDAGNALPSYFLHPALATCFPRGDRAAAPIWCRPSSFFIPDFLILIFFWGGDHPHTETDMMNSMVHCPELVDVNVTWNALWNGERWGSSCKRIYATKEWLGVPIISNPISTS